MRLSGKGVTARRETGCAVAAALFAGAATANAQPAPTGLEPAFANHVRCPAIASPFGSPTRHDGSARPASEFGGRHGGVDISVPEGTAILAIADGTVAAKGEGGMMEGVYLWLRHAPGDTGLAYWVYTKYQHLDALPDLATGDRVSAGQIVARSGKTGTEGRHYGPRGYAHLHLGTATAATGDGTVGGRGEARGVRLVDPLAVYRDAGGARDAARVSIAPVRDGKIEPAGSRLVWPIACETRP
jgi:murein DD-endopeptidase MepM/ murein hydrolase activator NlpD